MNFLQMKFYVLVAVANEREHSKIEGTPNWEKAELSVSNMNVWANYVITVGSTAALEYAQELNADKGYKVKEEF